MQFKEKNDGCLAFTLVELSISLIIISIIVGLILSGNNLAKFAQYRKIIADFNYYFISVKNFQSRYNALPGDMVGTSTYWSGTADGNNDGNIGVGDGSDGVGESTRAWQHLSLSGLIQGSYTGVSAGTPIYKQNVNTPDSPISNGFYSLYYFKYSSGIYGKSQNAVSFASNSSIPWNGSILSSNDAYNIDSKADDGNPSTGQIYVIRGSEYTGTANKCVSADYSSTSSSFVFSDTTISCRLLFWLK